MHTAYITLKKFVFTNIKIQSKFARNLKIYAKYMRVNI